MQNHGSFPLEKLTSVNAILPKTSINAVLPKMVKVSTANRAAHSCFLSAKFGLQAADSNTFLANL